MKISKRWKIEKSGEFWRIVSVSGAEPKWAEEFANKFTSIVNAAMFAYEKMRVRIEI